MEIKAENQELNNFNEVREQIIQDVYLLEDKLNQYGSNTVKGKKRNCIFCSSSDGLEINSKNKNHIQGHCFACSKNFDVINLVEEKENLSFYKSLELLANEKGLVLSKSNLSNEDRIKVIDLKAQRKAKESLIEKINIEKKRALEEKNIDKAFEMECKQDVLIESKNKRLKYPNLDTEGRPLKTWDNLQVILEHNDIYAVFNQITKNAEIKGLGSDDLDDCIMDIHTLCQTYGLKFNIDFIGKSINRIASKNTYNPIKDFLIDCLNNWDCNEGRIKKLCDTLMVSEDFSDDLRDKLVTKWLLNTVKIPFNTGKFNTEGVLVLQGNQGIRKTTWINKLVPIEVDDYLKTGLDLDPGDKDKIYQAIKYWVVELGELDSTMKSEQSKLKAFFTEKTDEFRRPYAKNPSKYPRLTSFFGTVNKREFLKDETGTRRYWVVPCEKILIDEVEKIDMKQLWGEVMYLSQKGEMVHYLTEQELEELNSSNKDFRVKGKTEISINSIFNWESDSRYWKFMTSEEVANLLGLQSTVGLNEIFNNLGIKQTKGSVKIGGKVTRPRGYKVPPVKVNSPVEWDNI